MVSYKREEREEEGEERKGRDWRWREGGERRGEMGEGMRERDGEGGREKEIGKGQVDSIRGSEGRATVRRECGGQRVVQPSAVRTAHSTLPSTC